MPTSVELFAGCGGASLGLKGAGFHSRLQVEWDANACATLHAAGFSDVHQGDVREAPLGGLGPIDLLWASPPCQPYSNMGAKLGAKDGRDGFPWTFDAIDRMDPVGWVICENVMGLVQHGNCAGGSCRGCSWELVVAEFKSRFSHVEWRSLNAADFGVPQHRERVFLVAGSAPVRWPMPTHSRAALLHAKWGSGRYWTERGLPAGVPSPQDRKALTRSILLGPPPPELPWVTIRDAIGLTKAVRVENTGAVSRSVDDVSPTLTTRGLLYTYPRAGDARKVDGGIRLHTLDEGVVEDGQVEGHWFDDALVSLVPPAAMRAPDDRRRVSVPEYCVLQGFPAEYPLAGDAGSRYRQIGNAVPPVMAMALAKALFT